MGFRRFTTRKKHKKQPPSLEVVNTAMLPKTTDIAQENVPLKKRKRGRPKSSANNNAHLHIKCPDDLMHTFKLLAVQERKTYPELLQSMIEAYEYVQDDD